MRKGLVAFAAATAVSLCATAVMAENRAGAVNLTPVIGGYHFDGTIGVDPNVLYGLKAGYNFTDRLGMEAMLHFINTKEWLTNRTGQDLKLYNYRMEVLYHLFPQSSVVPFLAVGGGGLHSEFKNSSDDSGLISYGLGAKFALTDNLALRTDLRMMSVFYNPSVIYNYEYTLGLNFQLGGSSKAVKAVAAAPKQAAAEPAPKVEPAPKPVPPPAPKPAPAPVPAPAPAPAPVVKPAPVIPPPAPAPAPAPQVALAANPASIDQGAASTLSWSSQNSTSCTLQPGIGPVAATGSMTVTLSTDTTYKLTCNGPGGTADSNATIKVIATVKDSDNDGVNDNLDKCPNTPANTKVDSDGCPVPECKSATLHLEFDTNKAEIKPSHHSELKFVVDKLLSFPKATTVIEGHTDSKGSDSANLKLSQRRADAVRNFIIKEYGIDASRIKAKGYGESKPVSTNATEEGRRNNRRVDAIFTCPE